MFLKGVHEKSALTDFSKEMWVPTSKGLKHLNTVQTTPALTDQALGPEPYAYGIDLQLGFQLGVNIPGT